MESGRHIGRKRLHRVSPIPLRIQSPRSGLAMAHALRCFIHFPRWIAARTSVAEKEPLKFISLLYGYLIGSPLRLPGLQGKWLPLRATMAKSPSTISPMANAHFPNDKYVGEAVYHIIEDDFHPVLGFFQRNNGWLYRVGSSYSPRPGNFLYIQQIFRHILYTVFEKHSLTHDPNPASLKWSSTVIISLNFFSSFKVIFFVFFPQIGKEYIEYFFLFTFCAIS